MKNWHPASVIVIVLTIVIGAVVIATVGGTVVRGTALDQDKAELLDGMVTSVISIITMYVGAMVQKGKGKDE